MTGYNVHLPAETMMPPNKYTYKIKVRSFWGSEGSASKTVFAMTDNGD